MTGIQHGAISLIHPLRDSARIVCERYRDLIPDLSSLCILVPTRQAYAAVSRELANAANANALLLPKITTLRDWSAEVAIDGELLSDAHRELMLFDALRQREWFEHQGDLWAVVTELRSLCDELSRHKIGLPSSLDEWERRLEAAYAAKSDFYLRYEARLVFEAWRVLGSGATLDSVSRYHLQLRSIAEQGSMPLVAIGLRELTQAENDFLDRYGEKQSVLLLSDRESTDSYVEFLRRVWPESSEHQVPLSGRAQQFATEVSKSPAADRLSFYSAHGLEDEARGADVAIRSWLIEGKKSIAVVIQNRLVARRLRALLERAEVLVQDESGWTLSTVAAATVIMRLLDCVGNDFYHRDTLDLLKSPYIFFESDAADRKLIVQSLEQAIRKHSFAGGFEALNSLVKRAGVDDRVHTMLRCLGTARSALTQREATTRDWLDRLCSALDVLGISTGLLQDAAGQQVLELLAQLSEEISASRVKLSFVEWRRWLDTQFEQENFRDRDVLSPVLFTHLPAVPLRNFDAIVLLGADAENLPSPRKAGPFLNDAVRGDLGVPTSARAIEESRNQLLGLLARSGACLVTWQSYINGEENLLSPWLEVLQTFHFAAYGVRLLERHATALYDCDVLAIQPAAAMPRTAKGPAPSAPQLLPREVSVSAYKSVIACPYQFFARHLLRLNLADEVRETMDKRDYGEILHGVLHEFHSAFPEIGGESDATLTQALLCMSERAFSPHIENNFQASIWLIEWKATIAAYLKWQREREADGWRFVSGEVKGETALWEGEDPVTLKGRLDRIDRREAKGKDAEYVILDYKAKRPEDLRKALKQPGEEVQLSAYALLHDAAEWAQYVCINGGDVSVAPKDLLEVDPSAERERAGAVFKAIRRGARLPAQGNDDACKYCDANGLCRRAHWT